MRYLAIAFLVASLPVLAQDSAQYRACNDKAKAQAEMNACASDEAARVDVELNEVYHRLLSQAANQPEATAKIKTAERAWVAYRDAYMDAMYPTKNKQTEYGSIYPMEADLLRAKLTQRQVTAFKELLQQYSGEAGTSDTVDPKTGNLHLQVPMLTATLTSDKTDYSLADDIRLDVRVTNAGKSPLTVFGELLWGHAGGLVLRVTDTSNREVPAKALDDDMVIPSTLEDRNSFVVLSPNHYLGRTRVEHLSELVEKPGTYFIQVEYISPVPREFGQGPDFWSREKPPVWSSKIEVHGV